MQMCITFAFRIWSFCNAYDVFGPWHNIQHNRQKQIVLNNRSHFRILGKSNTSSFAAFPLLSLRRFEEGLVGDAGNLLSSMVEVQATWLGWVLYGMVSLSYFYFVAVFYYVHTS